MAKTSGELEKEFIEALKTNTGKDLKDWLSEVKTSGISKRNNIIKWLKTDQNFGHMNASFLTGIYLNGGKPVYASESELLDNQFAKYEDMRPLFERVKKAIANWDSAANFVVKKTYVSITKKREFAAINIRKGMIRVGLDLGDMPFDDHVEKSKLTGPMARISHMVTIHSLDGIDGSFFQLLEMADRRVNK